MSDKDEPINDQETSRTLEQLTDSGDAEGLDRYLDTLTPSETTRAIANLDRDDREKILTTLDPDDAADLLEDIPHVQAADLIEQLEPAEAASILEEVSSDERVDIVQELSNSEEVLAAMDPEEAHEVRRLAAFPDDVAAGLMITEFLVYPESHRVGDVVQDLQENSSKYTDYAVQYLYVQSDAGAFVGVVQLRDLLLNLAHVPLHKVMKRDVISVVELTTLDQLWDIFDGTPLFGVPVVGVHGELVGVVQRSACDEARAKRADESFLKSQGIVDEEIRTMEFSLRAKRRFGWLSINIFLNLISASVISYYQETLAAVISLAVFMPIISDMSGCSGNQAVAVSLRELVLGVTKPIDLFRVLLKELRMGIVCGIALGFILGAIATLWKGNFYLGAVIGTALALNTVIGVCIGGALPLLLKRFGKDPALASGPILTTVTDTCGFFIVLSFASLFLSKIVG